MRRQRTIYFNDARHFYLFVFEPPMRMEDLWRPVDEVAGTGVDTLVYGVARADGLFYPSRAGKSFRSDVDEIDNAIYWKVRHNILSLEERGVDILQALADRAHERGMEFFVSFRMGTYEGVGSPDADPAEVAGAWPMRARGRTSFASLRRSSRSTTWRASSSTSGRVRAGCRRCCSMRMSQSTPRS